MGYDGVRNGFSGFQMDSKGRVRVSRERREQLLDEFEKSGLSGAQFARTVGVKYQIFSDHFSKNFLRLFATEILYSFPMTSTLMSSRNRAVDSTLRLPDDRTNSSTGELRTPSEIGLAQLHQAPIPPVKCFSTHLRLPTCAAPRIKNVDFLLQLLDLILFSLFYSLTEGSKIPIRNHCGRLPGLINQKSPLAVSHDLYKIYKFTQNHTITSQLYTIVKLLSRNKLPFASTPNDKIPPHSLLYKNRSIKNFFSFSKSLPHFAADSLSCVIAQKSHKRIFKKFRPTFATPMAYNQKWFDCNRTPPLPDLSRTRRCLSALTAEHHDATLSSPSANAFHEKDRFTLCDSFARSKIQIARTLTAPLIIGHYRKLSALKFRPSLVSVKNALHRFLLGNILGSGEALPMKRILAGVLIRLFIAAVPLSSWPGCLAANWPEWRGPERDGSTTEKNFPISWSTESNVVWRVELPEAGNSSPIVWKDRVFVTQAIGKQRAILCVERSSGKVLWTSGPTYDEPEETMKESNPYCAASPVTDGERVIAHFGSAGLYCFDFNGRELWHAELGKISHPFGTASSPCLDGERCFVFVGPGKSAMESMVAVEKRSGKIAWRAEALQPNAEEMTKVSSNGPPIGSWSTPIVIQHDGRKELAMAFDFRFGAYDVKTGKLNWQKNGLGLQTYVTPLWTDGMLIPMSGTTTVAVKPPGRGDTEPETVWTQSKSKFRFGSGVATEKHLYYLSENGLAECWEKSTGKILWQERLQGPGKKMTSWSSLSMAGRTIYAPNQSGDVFVFAAEPAFRMLSTNSVAEPTNASLALAGGNVIMRTHRALWCFGKRKS
jgi:outer membrane protein assembly factor BamB